MPKLEINVDQRTFDALTSLRDTAELADSGEQIAKTRLKGALIAANHIAANADLPLRDRPISPRARRSALRYLGSFLAGRDPVLSDNANLAKAMSRYPDWVSSGVTESISKSHRQLVTLYMVAAVTEGAIDDEDDNPIIG